jgi:5-methylcytosine-specific restriction endonuclease McrA
MKRNDWDFEKNKQWRSLRFSIIEEQEDHNCYYCNKVLNKECNDITIDHLFPLSLGGDAFERKNLVICCKTCNKAKGSMLLEDFIPFILDKRKTDKKFIAFASNKFNEFIKEKHV